MPKNKIGGKHKHLKKAGAVEKKFDLLGMDDTIAYAYVTKPYGNRTFDAVIIKSNKLVRFQAQYKRRKVRVVVGKLIRLSLAVDFTKEFYVVDDLVGELETKFIEKSPAYKENYKRIRQANDMTHRDGDADTVFDFDNLGNALADEDKEKEKPKRAGISYDVVADIPDSSDESDFDIDDL